MPRALRTLVPRGIQNTGALGLWNTSACRPMEHCCLGPTEHWFRWFCAILCASTSIDITKVLAFSYVLHFLLQLQKCKTDGGDLISTYDQYEVAFLAASLYQDGLEPDGEGWIGLKRNAVSSYRCIFKKLTLKLAFLITKLPCLKLSLFSSGNQGVFLISVF